MTRRFTCQRASTRSSSWSERAQSPGRKRLRPRPASSADAPRPARGRDIATRHAAQERKDRELSREGESFLQVRRQVIIRLPLPNKRLKLAGGDRPRESEWCALTGHGLTSTTLAPASAS